VLKDSRHHKKVTRAGGPPSRGAPAVTNRRDANLSDGDRQADREAARYGRLIRDVQAGDRHAMETLLMRAQEVAYRFSLLVCGRPDDAEDAMQEALLKTYRFVDRIREPEAFRAWLYRTVRNACLIGRRRRVDEPAQLLSLDEGRPSGEGHERAIDAVEPSRDPEEQAINAALRTRLARALHAVPRPYRVVVFLREIEGLSTKEVGEVLGISEANVKTRLHRARLMLREQLERP
jgi:RNA polymerase sigma-70 factor (ECF subfamily)